MGATCITGTFLSVTLCALLVKGGHDGGRMTADGGMARDCHQNQQRLGPLEARGQRWARPPRRQLVVPIAAVALGHALR